MCVTVTDPEEDVAAEDQFAQHNIQRRNKVLAAGEGKEIIVMTHSSPWVR